MLRIHVSEASVSAMSHTESHTESPANPPSEFSSEFLSQIAKSKRVSAGELKALRIALRRNGSQDVANELGITQAAARKRLGEVYKKFEIPGKGPGKLASLRALLQSKAGESEAGESKARESKAGESKVGETADAAPTETDAAQPSEATEKEALSWLSQPLEPAAGTVGRRMANDVIPPTLDSAKRLNAFYGRRRELEDLAAWITKAEGRKLLAICGIGGIGKTALAAQLVRNMKGQFEKVVWLSAEHRGEGKRPERLLQEAIAKLQGHATAHPASIDFLIDQFVDYLDSHRTLVVIDGLEQVFRSYSEVSKEDAQAMSTFEVRRQQQASAYKPGFEAYFHLLSAIQTQPIHRDLTSVSVSRSQEDDLQKENRQKENQQEENRQEENLQEKETGSSCVLVTSREKPRELLAIAQDNSTVRLQTLDGLKDDEAIALLEDFHIKGSRANYNKLISRYYGHPMALRLAGSTIKDAFFGKIRDFLDQEISVFDDLRSVIKTQFKRLSLSEKEVMYWLAINRDPCTIENLRADIVGSDHKHNVLYTLSSLHRRFLIEVNEVKGVASYRLHPIVADYVLNHFIRSMFLDLVRSASGLALFNSYALMKADADDDLREFQRQNIVLPILARLNNHCKSLYEAEKLLDTRLSKFRESNLRRLGYAGGNFVNLLVQLSEGQSLRDKDFSQLTIWQAYLQGVQLRDVNFNKCALDRSVFTETLSDVLAVAFTSLSMMAAGDANGKIHLWSTDTPAEKRAEWVAHSGWVRAIAFVPNRPLLVTGGDDNRLRLWQLPDTAIKGNPQALTYPTQLWQQDAWDWVHTVAVSPNGGLIASGGNDKITLYRTADGAEINSFADGDRDSCDRPVQKNRVRALAFSPDGRWLASCGDDYVVRVWSVASAQTPGQEAKGLLRFEGHRALIHTVRFSADGNWLVSGGADKVLYVWDVQKGEQRAQFTRPSDRIRSVAITNDGLLASGGDDCSIRLWNIHSLKHLKDISTGQSRVWSVDFQQQGDKLLLLAGGDKQTLMLWDVTESGNRVRLRPIRTYRGYTSGIRSVAVLSDQRIVGGGDRGELMVWDKENGDRKATLLFHQGRIWSIAVDCEHARIATASDDHTIRLWSAETGQCLSTLVGHNNWVRSVAFSRHGRFLVSAGDDCSVRVWNTASGFCRKTIDKFDAWVRSVAFDPHNSRYVITGGDEEVVKRWDIKHGHAFSLTKHDHRICSVACSPSGRLVASGSDDTTVKVWDMEKKGEIYTFENAELGIKSVSFSPDGRYLAGGGEDQIVYLWDLQSDDPEESCYELRPQDYQGLSGGIRSVAFSADSRYIISGGLDEMVRMGDLSAITQGGAQVMRPLIERDRPYENIKIENVKGLSDLQVANLMTLGATSRTNSLLQ